mmetsp:Transcript_30884/g.72571  ORF Transcript_30884/g.72571 Transcript_30884/m.72571 type:complete len:202 (-) Transcript_30884:420-1025(-)
MASVVMVVWTPWALWPCPVMSSDACPDVSSKSHARSTALMSRSKASSDDVDITSLSGRDHRAVTAPLPDASNGVLIHTVVLAVPQPVSNQWGRSVVLSADPMSSGAGAVAMIRTSLQSGRMCLCSIRYLELKVSLKVACWLAAPLFTTWNLADLVNSWWGTAYTPLAYLSTTNSVPGTFLVTYPKLLARPEISDGDSVRVY